MSTAKKPLHVGEAVRQLRLGYAAPVPTGAQRYARFELEETLTDLVWVLRLVLQGRMHAARKQHKSMLEPAHSFDTWGRS